MVDKLTETVWSLQRYFYLELPLDCRIKLSRFVASKEEWGLILESNIFPSQTALWLKARQTSISTCLVSHIFQIVTLALRRSDFLAFFQVLSKMRPRTKEKVTVVQLETFGIIFSISWENTGQVCLQDTDVRGFVRSEKGIIQKETI